MIRVPEYRHSSCVFFSAILALILSFSFWISGCAGAASAAKPASVAPSGGSAVTSVTITPSSVSTTTGGTLRFSATVPGTATSETVTWTAALGSINSSGAYTAPANAGIDKVTATSNVDSSKFASATVTVTASTPTPEPASGPSSNASCT